MAQENSIFKPQSPASCKYSGAPDCVECPLYIATITGRKAFEKIVIIIGMANESVRDDLIHAAITKYPFIEDAINVLGFQRIKDLGYNPKAVLNKLQEISDRSKEERVFKQLDYHVGNFYPYRKVDRDIKNVCSKMGETRRSVRVDTISRFYEVKFCKRKINGRFEYGYLILAPLNSRMGNCNP